MKIERVTSPHVAEPPPGRWSNALRVGDMLFISGMVSRANDGRTIEGRDEIRAGESDLRQDPSLVEAAGALATS
jgi:enamine deaminase RidA (YjgF/YER057c/UK114 family)